ncbi:lipopolysaccharide kinase InaA family protein [Lacinutrix iliipiscaria]|uniref:Lipopolysaccharide kinase InaA family protein n=1 Tax=Lacinutrix iliipiscaria TaxID=1230532 RepID=A0ABW5WQJ4_9FLAO
MKSVFQDIYRKHQQTLDHFITNFNDLGEQFGEADRNAIKLFDLEGETINIKSFKVPNIINQIAYKFFRKSKAERSFTYANRLTDLGIGTPQPIAYYEFTTPFLFKKSYYISEHLDCDLTYRELTRDLNYPDHDRILRAFTRFTYKLHENNINFLDHSPGNTLIKKVGDAYQFYLVDLNRMEFKPMDFQTRINNLKRLTVHKSMVETMSDEYAKVSGEDYQKIFNLMWQLTEDFQEKFHRKKRLKKKLKFWKS